MQDGQDAAKAQLRQMVLARRAALSEPERANAAQSVRDHFLSRFMFELDGTLAGYWPIREELDCKPLMAVLVENGQSLSLPVVLGPARPLMFRLWEKDAELFPSGFGALAPSELAPSVEPDLILMPLVGFDATGTRLGYGGGYYDRTLAALSHKPKLVGLAFAAQEIDEIPRSGHDVPLDAVVTENGVRFFS